MADPLTTRLHEIVWHIQHDLTDVIDPTLFSFPTNDDAVKAIQAAYLQAGWSPQPIDKSETVQ